MKRIEHPIPPVYDENSRILILGSFPSVKSREQSFFYAHPQNRFWRVVARICGSEVPCSLEEKKALLINNHIALWDVISSCEITGSSDSSIRNARPNDLSLILGTADIKRIFVNGRKAEALYNRYIRDKVHTDAVCLPSTSPANAAWSTDALYDKWNEEIKEYINGALDCKAR